MDEKTQRDKIENVVRLFVALSNKMTTYGEAHKISQDTLNELYQLLKEVLNEKEFITIGIVDGNFAFEDGPFYTASQQLAGFIEVLKKLKVHKLSFKRNIKKEELLAFSKILGMKPHHLKKDETIESIIKKEAIQHVSVGEINIEKAKLDDSHGMGKGPDDQTYKNYLGLLENASAQNMGEKSIEIKLARGFVNSIISSLLKNKDILYFIAATKSYDEYTFTHDVNVAIFTLIQAEGLGIEDEYLNDIGVAALLHDVGKLSVSKDILIKKDPLNPSEIHEILLHPIEGTKKLLETPEVSMLAALTAFEHHMLYDLTGYPKKLYADNLNLISMLITISDCYEALRSKRTYHEALPPEKVYDEMTKLSGKYFHPELLSNFFRIIGVYPPGTLVELDTKEVAVVLRENPEDLKRPHIEILYDAAGNKISDTKYIDLSKKAPDGSYGYTIVQSIISSDKFELPKKYM